MHTHTHTHVYREPAHTEHSHWVVQLDDVLGTGIHSMRYMCVIGLTLFYVCVPIWTTTVRLLDIRTRAYTHTPWARRIIIISSHLPFISNGKSSSYIFYFANSISRKHMILPRTPGTLRHGDTTALRHRGRYVQNVLFLHPKQLNKNLMSTLAIGSARLGSVRSGLTMNTYIVRAISARWEWRQWWERVWCKRKVISQFILDYIILILIIRQIFAFAQFATIIMMRPLNAHRLIHNDNHVVAGNLCQCHSTLFLFFSELHIRPVNRLQPKKPHYYEPIFVFIVCWFGSSTWYTHLRVCVCAHCMWWAVCLWPYVVLMCAHGTPLSSVGRMLLGRTRTSVDGIEDGRG